MTGRVARVLGASRAVLPGLALATGLAAAAAFVSGHYGGPTLLYALLLGMVLNPITGGARWRSGIAFAARPVLRLGVALLGVRITYGELLQLGPRPLVLVLLAVPVTIAGGLLLARRLGQGGRFGVLTGGAVAICGVSAAMAIASVLPSHERSERELVFTVIGVTSLSTLAMILYPLLTAALGLDAVTAGLFLGGTIHDVAQVVGAGYLLGEEAGDAATFTKLLRVGMLLPAVLVISLVLARREPAGARRPPLLPGFLLGFLALVALNSGGWIPAALQEVGVDLSRACLVLAIAAIGVKASLGELRTLGWTPLLLLLGETVLLAGFVGLLLALFS